MTRLAWRRLRGGLAATLMVVVAGAALWPKPVRHLATSPAPKTFAEAAAQIEVATGSKGQAGADPGGAPLDGVVLFNMKSDGMALVARDRAAFLPAGAFLFLYEHGFGLRDDVVALAPTTDKFDVVRRAQTDAPSYQHDNAAILEWLRAIDRDEPFDLTGAGGDFVEGVFRDPVQHPAELARSIYSFCPDFWSQGIGVNLTGDPNVLIAQYFSSSANREFFFWWD